MLGDGIALARSRGSAEMKGATRRSPQLLVAEISTTPLPFAGDVKSRMQDGDVFALDLQRQHFWVVGPAKDEIVPKGSRR